MEKLLNLLRRFLSWLDNLFSNLWTQPPSFSSKKPQQTEPPPSPSIHPPSAQQEELAIGSNAPPVYKKSDSILTFRERMLYRTLKIAAGSDHVVMAKVRMGDFIWLANEPKERKQHLNQIMCKHVDFLLCSRLRLAPVLVIELDDPSHQWAGREERDKFKDDVFASVGLPILRVKMQDSYDETQLGDQIRELIYNKSYFVSETDE